MLHIKLNGIANAATCEHILSLHKPSTPWVGSKLKTFFSDSSHVAYQVRRELSMEHHANTYHVLTHRLNPGVGSKVKPFFSESVMLHID